MRSAGGLGRARAGRRPSVAVTVHSTQLGHMHVTSGTLSNLYTVPAGKRTILKSIQAQNDNGAANRLQVALYAGASLMAEFNLYGAAANASGDSPNVQPWIVLNAGDIIKVAAAASGFYVIASGAELNL